jgi:hypothetical protein
MVTTLSGLTHLEAKAVSVLSDGNVEGTHTVASGSVTLNVPAAKVHIGLPFTSEVETLDFEFQTKTGTAQDKLRTISSCLLRLENTRDLFVGPDEDHLDEIKVRDTEDYDEPTALFTGSKEISIDSTTDMRGRVYLQNTSPVPFTVSAVIVRVDNGDN